MPLYRGNMASMPQYAQSAMNSATSAASSQQKQTTTITERKSDFWDDLYKGAKAVGALAGAANTVVGVVDRGIDVYDDIKVKGAYDNIAKAYGEGGLEAIQNNPDMQDYHHSVALGRFMQDRAKSQQGFMDMMKKSDEMADREYLDFRAQAMQVGQAYDRGDMERFDSGMSQLVASAPLPYRLEPDGKGNFKEFFRSDEQGGWVETGRSLSREEALNEMKGLLAGEQMVLRGADMRLSPRNEAFNRARFRNAFATHMGNAENQTDPSRQIRLYGQRTGQPAGIGVRYNSLRDYNANGQIRAFDMNGRALGQFDGIAGLMQSGLTPYAPKMARGGSGGGGRGGGSGGAEGTVAGSFRGSASDNTLFTKYSTATDPDTGEKATDYGKVAFFQDFQRKSGLTGAAAIAAFESNVKAAAASMPGVDRERVEALVMAAMQERLAGGRQGQAVKSPQARDESAVGETAAQGNGRANERIRRAAGENVDGMPDPYQTPPINMGINPAGAYTPEERQMAAGRETSRMERSNDINRQYENEMRDYDAANYGRISMGGNLAWEKGALPKGRPSAFGPEIERRKAFEDLYRY